MHAQKMQWVVVNGNEIHDHTPEMEDGIRIGDTPNLIATVAVSPFGLEQHRLNGLLLAAAPALLEAVKAMRRQMEEEWGPHADFYFYDKLIAKAEGRDHA